MKMKKLFALLLAIAMVFSLAACGGGGEAENEDPYADYPNGSINCIVPFAAGGGQHVLATAVAAAMDETTLVVTNVTGGGGATGTMEALHSTNDGYTVVCTTTNNPVAGAFNGTYPEPDAWERLVPVAICAGDRMTMIASKASGFTSLDQIIEYSKAHPGEVTITGATANSYTQKVIEKFMADLGVEWRFIPFDGESAARNATMGGQVDLCLFGVGAASTALDSGDCVGICMLSAAKSSFYPDMETVAYLGGVFENYDFTVYRAFYMPEGTDAAVAAKFGDLIAKVVEDEEFKATCDGLFLEIDYHDAAGMQEVLDRTYTECAEMYAN